MIKETKGKLIAYPFILLFQKTYKNHETTMLKCKDMPELIMHKSMKLKIFPDQCQPFYMFLYSRHGP